MISGATAEELKMLEEQAKELGRTTAFTAGEVAGFQKELAKLGFDPTEISAMTESVLDLAFAFGDDMNEAGTQVGVVLNAFQLDASETTRVTDVLAKAFASTPLDLQKFSTAFPKVGAIAKEVGFSLEGTVAMLGQLQKSGMDASMVGTSLKNIFLKLAKPTGALSVALGRNVTSVDELVPALKELQAKGIDVAGMLELTDQRSVTAFANLLSGADDIDVLNQSLLDASGTTKEFADTMRDSLKGELDETKSAAEGFALQLGEEMSPAIEGLLNVLQFLINGLTLLLPAITNALIALAAYNTAIVLSKVNTLGFAGTMRTTRITTGLYTAGKWLATYALRAFNAAIKMSPLGWFITGITAVVTAVSYFTGATAESTEAVDANTEAIEGEVDALTEEQEVLSETAKIREKYDEKLKENLGKLEMLKNALSNQNMTKKELNKTLKEYNKLAGTDISNLQSKKEILDQVADSYEDIITQMTREIILESSKEQIAVLLKQRLALNEKIALQTEENNKARKADQMMNKREFTFFKNKNNLQLNNLENLKESIGLNKENSKIEIDDSKIIGNNLKNKINSGSRINELLEENNFLQKDNSAVQDEIAIKNNRYNEVEQLQREAKKVEQIEELIRLGKYVDINEIQATGQLGQIANLLDRANASNAAIMMQNNLNESLSKEGEIGAELAEIYAEMDKLLSELTFNKKTFTEDTDTDPFVSAFKQLKNSVKIAEGALRELILTSDDSAESQEKIATAVDNLNTANKNLEDGLLKLEQGWAGVTLFAKDYLKALRENKRATQEQIDDSKSQIRAMELLGDTNAEVAYRRIRLALEVAQSELDLALDTIRVSGMATDAQIEDINRLTDKVNEAQNNLDAFEGTQGGFLQRGIFGTNEDGEPFTGEDFLDATAATLQGVMGVLNEFNALQQEQLQNQLGTIERNKNKEVKEFEDSAEFQIMTAEQRTAKIEEIEQKHDDAMLKLKIDQFKKDQALAIADAIISGGLAIMSIWAGTVTKNPVIDKIIKGILTAAQIGMTAMQLATIKAQKPPTAELGGIMDDSFFAKGGMVNGKPHSQGGEKFAVGGRVAELEGGEAVINKKSTQMFKPLLSQMNVAGGGKKFHKGGIIHQFHHDIGMVHDDLFAMQVGTQFDNQERDFESQDVENESLLDGINNQKVLLVEADVTESQKTVKNIESRISF